MKTFSEFLQMGGYAVYVWSAYGLCSAILVWNLVQARRQSRQTIKRIKQRLLHQDKIQ